MTEEVTEVEAAVLVARAKDLLRDAQNPVNSRHTRLSACFDAIYCVLLVAAMRAGRGVEFAQMDHPGVHVIIAGGDAVGLADEETSEVLALGEAVLRLRFAMRQPEVNLRRALALARYVSGEVGREKKNDGGGQVINYDDYRKGRDGGGGKGDEGKHDASVEKVRILEQGGHSRPALRCIDDERGN